MGSPLGIDQIPDTNSQKDRANESWVQECPRYSNRHMARTRFSTVRNLPRLSVESHPRRNTSLRFHTHLPGFRDIGECCHIVEQTSTTER